MYGSHVTLNVAVRKGAEVTVTLSTWVFGVAHAAEESLLDQGRVPHQHPAHPMQEAAHLALKDCVSTFILGLPRASCCRELGRAGGILMEGLPL